jgi:hypothetical protein
MKPDLSMIYDAIEHTNSNLHKMETHVVGSFPQNPFKVGELLVWFGENRNGGRRTPYKKLVTVTQTFPDNAVIYALVEGKEIAFYDTQSTVHSLLERAENFNEF